MHNHNCVCSVTKCMDASKPPMWYEWRLMMKPESESNVCSSLAGYAQSSFPPPPVWPVFFRSKPGSPSRKLGRVPQLLQLDHAASLALSPGWKRYMLLALGGRHAVPSLMGFGTSSLGCLGLGETLVERRLPFAYLPLRYSGRRRSSPLGQLGGSWCLIRSMTQRRPVQFLARVRSMRREHFAWRLLNILSRLKSPLKPRLDCTTTTNNSLVAFLVRMQVAANC